MEEKMKNRPRIRFEGYSGEWERRTLEEIGHIVTGSTPSTANSSYYSENGTPWVTPTDINDNVTYDTAKKLSLEGEKVSRMVPADTILVTSIASIGKNTLLGERGSFNQQINGLIPDFDSYNPYFLYTNSALWSDEMRQSAASGTMQIVNKTEFSRIETLVPSLPEQSKIGTLFQQLDTLTAQYRTKLTQLRNIKQSMLTKLFPQEGESVPQVRFEGFEGEWEKKRLGDLGTVEMNRRIFKEQTSVKGEIPFYKIGTFGGTPDAYISRELFEEYKKNYAYPKVGDILISASGSIGRTVEYKGADEYFQDSNIVWLNHDGKLNNRFLKYAYSIIKWEGLEGSTIKRLYNRNILNTTISVPSLEEQHQIGQFFQQLDTLLSQHQKRIDKLTQLKSALLEGMFV